MPRYRTGFEYCWFVIEYKSVVAIFVCNLLAPCIRKLDSVSSSDESDGLRWYGVQSIDDRASSTSGGRRFLSMVLFFFSSYFVSTVRLFCNAITSQALFLRSLILFSLWFFFLCFSLFFLLFYNWFPIWLF